MLSCLFSGPPVVQIKVPFPSRSQIYNTVIGVDHHLDCCGSYHHSNIPNIHLFIPRHVANYFRRPILIRLDIGHVVIFPKPCLAKVAKHWWAIPVDGGNEWSRTIDYSIYTDFARYWRHPFQTSPNLARQFSHSSRAVYCSLGYLCRQEPRFITSINGSVNVFRWTYLCVSP